VSAARERLAPLLNIDPESVAVIDGQIIDSEDDHIIREDVQSLSFVKRSSVKG
jgi:hypothetical protein